MLDNQEPTAPRKKDKGRSLVLTTIAGCIAVAEKFKPEGQEAVTLTILVESGKYQGLHIKLIGIDPRVQTLMNYSPGQRIAATGSLDSNGDQYQLTVYSIRPEE